MSTDAFADHIALRVRDREGGSRLYPASAFNYLSHSLRHTVHATIGGNIYSLVNCATEEECFAVENAIFNAICGYPEYPPYRPCVLIYDLTHIAHYALEEIRNPPPSDDAIGVWNRAERKIDPVSVSSLLGATIFKIEDDGAGGVAWIALRLKDGEEIVLNPAGESDTISALWLEESS